MSRVTKRNALSAAGRNEKRTLAAVLVRALAVILAVSVLAACSQSSGSDDAAEQSGQAADKARGNIEVRDEYLGEWKTAVLFITTKEIPPEASDDDWTLTISKDGVARYSTGETFFLEYPSDEDDDPAQEYDYYFVDDKSLPSGYENILFDTWGEDSDELWESHYLENGHQWTYVYTRDGEPPESMREELGYEE